MRTILLILMITLLASAAFGQGAAPSPVYWHYQDSLLRATGWHFNPPSSWIGDPSHTRLQILNWDENVVDTTVVNLFDTSAYLPNADTNMTFAGYSGAAIHPSVELFPYQWNGYRYWMAVSGPSEKPYIFVSNDNKNFHPFIDSTSGTLTFGDTLVNPLDTSLTGCQITDNYLFYDNKTDKLWCLWRQKCDGFFVFADTLYYETSYPESTKIEGRYTYDGLHWSDKYTILRMQGMWVVDSAGGTATGTRQDTIAACGNRCLSFSIERIGDEYRMWAVNAFAFYNQVTNTQVYFHDTSLYMWTAESIEGPWDTAGYCTLPVTTGNHEWHPEVTKGPDSLLWCLHLEDTTRYKLTLSRSSDSGRTFTLFNSHVINPHPTYGAWDYILYKASPIFNDFYYFPGKGLYTMFGVYYSSTGIGGKTGYTEALLPLVYDTSGGTGGGSSDSLGIDTDANGTIDQWLYGGSGVIGMIRAGANITLSVSGETLYVAGPAGSGTADSVGVDTSGNGTVDCYLYSTSGAAAVIKEGSGITLTVSADSMTITLNAGPIINDSLDARLAAYPDTAATVDTIQGVLANLNYITASGVTYENLSANSDIGTGATQVAQGNHAHTGVYQPKDATLDTLAVGHIREDLTITGDYTLNATGNIILNQNASDATTMSYLYAYYYTTEMLSSYLRFNPATMRWSILDTLSVPALWVASQKIDNDTGLVSEGELEDSLNDYSNTTTTQGIVSDSITAHTIPTSKAYFDTTTVYDIDSLIVLLANLADSARKIDTGYDPLLAFVNNHSGSGSNDSLAVDTTDDGVIDGYLYGSTGVIGMLREGYGFVISKDTDTLRLRIDTTAIPTLAKTQDLISDSILANAYAVDWNYFLVVSDSLTVIKADSAVKALQDASGNTITSYYAAKSGATYTGTHDFTGATLSIPNDAVTDEDIDWTDVTLADFTEQTAWQVFYSNGTGDVTELALGADGTYLKSNGAAAIPSWATPGGSGDVSKVGTPVDNQVGVWTGDGTLEGDADLTFDGTNLSIAGTLDGVDLSAFNAGVSDDTATWKTLTTGFETDSIGADTLIANTVFKYPGGFIDNDTGVVTEGELEASLVGYQLTTSDIDPDRLTGDATDNDRVDSAVCAPVVHKAERDASGNVITTTYAPILPDTTEIDTASVHEWLADRVGEMVTGNTETNITVSYDDADNTLDFVVTGGSGGSSDSLTIWAGADYSTINNWLKLYFRNGFTVTVGDSAGVVDTISVRADTTLLATIGKAQAIANDTADVVRGEMTDTIAANAYAVDWNYFAVVLDALVVLKADSTNKALRDAAGNIITATYAPIFPDSTEIDSANIREWVADKVGGMVTGNTETGISVTYDDADNTLDFVVSGSVGPDLDLDSLSADTVVVNTVLKVPGNLTIDNDTSLVSEGELEDSLDTYQLIKADYDLDSLSADTVVVNTVLKVPGNLTINHDTSLVSEGELEDSLDNYTLSASDIDPDKLTGDATDNDRVDSAVCAPIVHKAERDASGNIITSTYTLGTDFAKVTDDSTALKAAKDSVAAWDNGNLDSANMKTDGIATSDINWKYEYVDLTIPSGRGITADSTAMIPFWRGFLFRDSTWFTTGSDVDTCWVSGSVKDSCTIDSLIFVYRSDGTGVIDKVNLYGPDLSNAINGTDSAYYETDVNLTATSLTRVAYYINETGVKAGYRFKIEFVNTLANDNDYIDVQWVQLCIKR